MTQKEAIFNAITSILDEHDIEFEPKIVSVNRYLDEDKKAEIVELVVKGFTNYAIDISEEAEWMLQDKVALREFTINLLSYWIRRDPRLNGGIYYV